MTDDVDPKVAKLPRWARGIIAEQQNEIDRLNRELAFATRDQDIEAWAYRTDRLRTGEDTPVAAKYDSLEVRLGGYDEGLNHERKLNIRRTTDGLLEVRGGRAMVLTPKASNVVEIDVVNW